MKFGKQNTKTPPPQPLPSPYENQIDDVSEQPGSNIPTPPSTYPPPLPSDTKHASVFDGTSPGQNQVRASTESAVPDVDRFRLFPDQQPPQGFPSSNLASAGLGKGQGRLWKPTSYFSDTAAAQQTDITPDQLQSAVHQLEQRQAAEEEALRRQAIQAKLQRKSARLHKQVDIAVWLAVALMLFNPLFGVIAVILATLAMRRIKVNPVSTVRLLKSSIIISISGIFVTVAAVAITVPLVLVVFPPDNKRTTLALTTSVALTTSSGPYDETTAYELPIY